MTLDSMRVVLHESDETIEFHLLDGRWVGDDGTRVSIDAMVPATAIRPVGNRGLTLSA
jgi:hypothetical protein